MTLVDEPADETSLGIQPVPPSLRRLRTLDIGVLWGDLAVGVLVLAAGALLVAPTSSFGLGMDLPTALAAIVVGSVAGSLLLALVGAAGHDRGVPTMTLLRPVLGRGGSYGASIINVVQLIGWTSFEFWAMALLASRVSQEVFGFSGFDLWLAVVAVGCIASASLGPDPLHPGVARTGRRLDRAGQLRVPHLVPADPPGPRPPAQLGRARERRSRSVSTWWSPSRCRGCRWSPTTTASRPVAGRTSSAPGPATGSATCGSTPWAPCSSPAPALSDASPAGIAVSILGLSAGTVIGVLLLSSLLVGETHEAFADIYSAAVSGQNLFPRLPQRAAVVAVGIVAAVIAAFVTLGSYEAFLFLLGSVFVPLFAVLLADWVAGGPARAPADPTRSCGRAWCWRGSPASSCTTGSSRPGPCRRGGPGWSTTSCPTPATTPPGGRPCPASSSPSPSR